MRPDAFFLGVHRPHWLWDDDFHGVPLFVSHRTLSKRRGTFPRAVTTWSLDSGGFSELDSNGRWDTTPQQYVEAVRRYATELGGLQWASPQDWMCEPWIVAKTGKTVEEHQRLTVANGVQLRAMAPDLPFIFVVQGWSLPDYERCLRMYAEAGVDLAVEPVVGIGSVCRRQSTQEIGDIFDLIRKHGINPHGFGVKSAGLKRYGKHLSSADSMAWSYRARRLANDRRAEGLVGSDPDCDKTTCANCKHFALSWRHRLLAVLPATTDTATRGSTMPLGTNRMGLTVVGFCCCDGVRWAVDGDRHAGCGLPVRAPRRTVVRTPVTAAYR